MRFGSLPRAGVVSLCALAIEFTLLSLLYDLALLGRHDRPWAFLGRLGDAVPFLFIAAAVAVAVSVGARAGSATRSASPERFATTRNPKHDVAVFWLGSLGVAGLLGASATVLRPAPPSTLQFALWLAAALFWLACRTWWAWPAQGARAVLNALPTFAAVAAVALAALLAGLGTRALWAQQSGVVLEAVVLVLRGLGQHPERVAQTELWLGEFGVDIAPSCSGYEGVGLMVAFVGGFAVLTRRQLDLSRAWPVLPIAVFAVWVFNILRIAALMWLGAFVSADWAAGAFHSKAGWLLFCAIALLAVVALQRIGTKREAPFDSKADPTPDARLPHVPAAPAGELPVELDIAKSTTSHLLPLVTFSAAALVTGLLFEPLDRLYGLRVAITGFVLVALKFRFSALTSSLTWPAVTAGFVAFGLWLLLIPELPQPQLVAFSQQLAELGPAERTFWFVSRVVGATLIVPVAEELAFRGYLTRRLASPDFVNLPHQSAPLWALGVSTALFAVLHGAVLAAFAAGAVYALLVRVRGRLGEAMVAHAVTNLALCVLALATGNVAHWM